MYMVKNVSRKKDQVFKSSSHRTTHSREPVCAPFGILNPHKGTPSILSDNEIAKCYLNCKGEAKCLQIAAYYLHNPKIWRAIYYQMDSSHLKKMLRSIVQIQTIEAVLRGKYFLKTNSGISSVHLDKKLMIKASQSTRKYESEHKFQFFEIENPCNVTEYFIVAADCLEVASVLAQTYLEEKPIVLNMASLSLAGGGWRKASAAQEENLHRRTNLFQCLEDPYHVTPLRQWSYPLPQFGGLYIPHVTVFRGSERAGYPFLNKPEFFSFVAVAAFKMPSTETDKSGEEILDKKMVRDTKRKIEVILNIALENRHNIIILSAFGCGVYENPPAHIARLFKEVLQSKKYKGRFRVVAFAIIDPQTFKLKGSDGEFTQSMKKARIFGKIFQRDLLVIQGECFESIKE